MANIAAYSRHKMLEELNSPLYSSTVGGDTYFLTPAQQKAQAMANLLEGLSDTQIDAVLDDLMGAAALPTGAAITTGATTTLAAHYRTSPVSGIIMLDLADFAVGTSADDAALGIGASVISFPTDTWVGRATIDGSLVLADDGQSAAADVGLGTTVASGAVSVLGGTAGFESVLGGTTSSTFSDTGATATATILAPGTTTIKAAITDGIVLRTTTPGLAIFLNVAATWADLDAAAALTFTGRITMEYRTGI